jgi:hypothetical protein
MPSEVGRFDLEGVLPDPELVRWAMAVTETFQADKARGVVYEQTPVAVYQAQYTWLHANDSPQEGARRKRNAGSHGERRELPQRAMVERVARPEAGGLRMIAEVYQAFGVTRSPRRTITVRCPLHGGESLTITDQGTKALVACGAGCDTETVLAMVGLDWGDLFW